MEFEKLLKQKEIALEEQGKSEQTQILLNGMKTLSWVVLQWSQIIKIQKTLSGCYSQNVKNRMGKKRVCSTLRKPSKKCGHITTIAYNYKIAILPLKITNIPLWVEKWWPNDVERLNDMVQTCGNDVETLSSS